MTGGPLEREAAVRLEVGMGNVLLSGPLAPATRAFASVQQAREGALELCCQQGRAAGEAVASALRLQSMLNQVIPQTPPPTPGFQLCMAP